MLIAPLPPPPRMHANCPHFELLAKVLALVHNDTSALDASSTPRLQPHEVSTVSAANQTLQALFPDLLVLMDSSINETDEAAWERLLLLANLTHETAENTMRMGPSSLEGPTLLSAGFIEARRRRAADARAQSTFEELIAIVRAEDPSLAAEDAKKAASTARYEAKREGWLGALLHRAAAERVPEAIAALQRAQLADTESGPEPADTPPQPAPDMNGVSFDSASVATWATEWGELRARRVARAREASSIAERNEAKKHEHYARLLKLPRLIDETLSTWIDPADDLSDKQIFLELLRMMGLPETVEPRLMRAMVEAVKQHRLRREREEMERGDWADLGAEDLALRAGWRTAHPPALRSAEALVNRGGDGNEFALFVASLLQAIGARVRVAIGCSRNVTVPPPEADGLPWASFAVLPQATAGGADQTVVCQALTEVRLGRNPTKVGAWVRAWLPNNKWLGRRFHYRLDREGYVWLNLDWVDGGRLQRPGVPYKKFDSSLVTYYPGATPLMWEVDGEELDSAGVPKPRKAPVESLRI